MNIKGLFDAWEKIVSTWERRLGLFFFLIFINIVYFYFLSTIHGKQSSDSLFTIVIPVSVSLALILFWIFSTNRFFIKGPEKLSVGLMISIDEEEVETRIKKIVKKAIKEINEDFSGIKIRLYPINYKSSKKQVEAYLRNRAFSLDALVFCEIESGNFKNENRSEERIILKQAFFVGNLNFSQNKEVFRSSINMANDLRIRWLHKDWAYIEENSGVDKNKLRANFRDTILHYAGIYLVYLNKYDLALNILRSLHNPKASIVNASKNGQIKISSESLAACRLNNILINLFFFNAIRNYEDRKDFTTSYRLLKDCEQIFNRHTDSYLHHISLARFSYEMGSLSEARNYTQKAYNLRGETIDILLNRAFFHLIENNANKLAACYKKIKNRRVRDDYNFVEVVAFLGKEREKIQNRDHLFDFIEACLYKLFIDVADGTKKMEKFISTYSDKSDMNSLIVVARSIQSTTLSKSPATRKTKGKKRKKK
jgi:hypothetical protein